MHELYYWEAYIEIPGEKPECFCSGNYFTETEQTENIDRFDNFDDFLKWSEATDMTGVEVCTSHFLKIKEVTFYGIRFNITVTCDNFKPGTTVRTKYKHVSPKLKNLEYFKQNLSLDDFITFMQEHCGDKVVIAVK